VREELLLGFGGEVECCVIDVAVRWNEVEDGPELCVVPKLNGVYSEEEANLVLVTELNKVYLEEYEILVFVSELCGRASVWDDNNPRWVVEVVNWYDFCSDEELCTVFRYDDREIVSWTRVVYEEWPIPDTEDFSGADTVLEVCTLLSDHLTRF
jgi:hypothetical protein